MKCPPAFCFERFQIADRLGQFQIGKTEFFAGNRKALNGLRGDHEKQARVGPAFVQLPRGVKIAGADPDRHGGMGPIPQRALKLHEFLSKRFSIGKKRQNTYVIPGFHGFPKRIEGFAGYLHRQHFSRLGHEKPRFGLVFNRLNVGLIKRVDFEQDSGDRHGHFPFKKLAAQLMFVLQTKRQARMAVLLKRGQERFKLRLRIRIES